MRFKYHKVGVMQQRKFETLITYSNYHSSQLDSIELFEKIVEEGKKTSNF